MQEYFQLFSKSYLNYPYTIFLVHGFCFASTVKLVFFKMMGVSSTPLKAKVEFDIFCFDLLIFGFVYGELGLVYTALGKCLAA